jgi:hypothetical protein
MFPHPGKYKMHDRKRYIKYGIRSQNEGHEPKQDAGTTIPASWNLENHNRTPSWLFIHSFIDRQALGSLASRSHNLIQSEFVQTIDWSFLRSCLLTL